MGSESITKYFLLLEPAQLYFIKNNYGLWEKPTKDTFIKYSGPMTRPSANQDTERIAL